MTSRNLLGKLLLALLIAPSFLAQAGQLTGAVQLSNGQPIVNGTFTFTLSQSAIAAGSSAVASSSVNCYTSANGLVVGLPDPIVLPVVSGNINSGTLASGTYYVKLTYYTATGETIPSPELSVVLSASGSLVVTAPVLQPSAALGYRVYIGTTTGGETLQSSVVGFGNYTQSLALISGSALPLSNTVACSLRFNDELIPTYTNYSANLVNKNGAQIAGFPQRWYLSGGASGTINLSLGTPLYFQQVVYPSAIISVPQLNAQQSINGPLTLNSYGLTAGLGQLYSALSTSNQYQLRLGIDATDTGMYAISGTSAFSEITNGAGYDGTNHYAKVTAPSILNFATGSIRLYSDSGLTVGSTFTPTKRFSIESNGNPAQFMPSFPQGYSDWTNAGACSVLSTTGHGILCYDKNANAFKFSANGGAFTVVNGGGQGFYNTIQQAGVALAQEPTINFIGGAVTCVDNAGSTRTDCPILNTSSTIGSGSSFTLTVDTGYGATGTNPTIAYSTGGSSATIKSGVASNAANGDSLNLTAASSISTTANGGALNITAGNAGSASGTAGSVNISAGTITAAGTTGDINLNAGNLAGGATGKLSIVTHGGVEITNGQTPAVSGAFNSRLYQDGSGRLKLNENADSRGYFNLSGQSGPPTYGFCTGVASAGATLFLYLQGATLTTCTDTTATMSVPMPSAGILRNLRAKSSAAGVNGSSGVITLNVNGAGSALTCTVGTSTVCSDTTHTATVAAGDLISVQFTTQGGETLANLRVSFEKQ